MEIEFDKEIDALLKKAGKSGAPAASVFDSHLDADEISMFAENAAPEAARTRMIGHFADCDRCRTILTNVIALKSESPAPTESALPVPEEIVDEGSGRFVGWLSPRNLAFGFGALALMFSAFIGIGLIRNMSSGETQLAQADEKEISQPATRAMDSAANANSAEPAAGDTDSENANAEALAMDSDITSEPPLELAKNEAVTGKDVARRQPAASEGFSGSRADIGRLRDSKVEREEQAPVGEAADAAVLTDAAPVATASAPAPPAPRTDSLTMRAGVEKKKEDDEARLAANKAAATAESPAGEPSGSKRQISGKTFNRRNGVWYDSAYRNQPTTTVRRGTPEYRSLDSGVRTIAEQLSGTVVVLWKTKAYKIQ